MRWTGASITTGTVFNSPVTTAQMTPAGTGDPVTVGQSGTYTVTKLADGLYVSGAASSVFRLDGTLPTAGLNLIAQCRVAFDALPSVLVEVGSARTAAAASAIVLLYADNKLGVRTAANVDILASKTPVVINADDIYQIDVIVGVNTGTPSTTNGRIVLRVKDITNPTWNTTGEWYWDSGYATNTGTVTSQTVMRWGKIGTAALAAGAGLSFAQPAWDSLTTLNTSTDPTITKAQFMADPATSTNYTRTADGTSSGTGAASASVAYTVTANGTSSGDGSGSAGSAAVTATASGTSTGTGVGSAVVAYTATGSGTTTGTGTATASVGVTRTASGTAAGTGTATANSVTVQATANGTSTGTGTATSNASASFTRTANGTSAGTGTAAVTNTTRQATANGTGSGTGTISVNVTTFTSTPGTGRGDGTATVVVALTATTAGTGTGTGDTDDTIVTYLLVANGTTSGDGTAAASAENPFRDVAITILGPYIGPPNNIVGPYAQPSVVVGPYTYPIRILGPQETNA